MKKGAKQSRGRIEWSFEHEKTGHELTGDIFWLAHAPDASVGASWNVVLEYVSMTGVRSLDGVSVAPSDPAWLETLASHFETKAEDALDWREAVIFGLNEQSED